MGGPQGPPFLRRSETCRRLDQMRQSCFKFISAVYVAGGAAMDAAGIFAFRVNAMNIGDKR
jgi:hypothetical protein